MRCKKHLSDATSAVGVCSSCLRERLISLIAAQAKADLQPNAAQLSPTKSDPHPPALVFPRSVSPYVSRRKEDSRSPLDNRHHRFYSTPQVRPTYNCTTTAFVTTASISRKHRTMFSLWSSLFRSRSEKLDSVPADSSPSSSSSAYSSSSWLSSLFSRRKNRSIGGSVDAAGQMSKPSRFFSRGMSPDGDYDGYDEYESEASKWKASPAAALGSTRRGRAGLSRNVSGVAFCLSPLVRASPNRHWNQGLPPESTYSGEIRVSAKPHLAAAASFCGNRSRKLADLGRVNRNR